MKIDSEEDLCFIRIVSTCLEWGCGLSCLVIYSKTVADCRMVMECSDHLGVWSHHAIVLEVQLHVSTPLTVNIQIRS